MVSRLTGYQVQPNKAIVGRNAFAHESGIHQDGVLKERTTYEIMDATTIGLEANSMVLGKHSGSHALRNALEELGFKVDGAALNTAFKRFKELADKKKKVTALDLEAIVSDEMRQAPAAYELVSFDIEASSMRPRSRGWRAAARRRAWSPAASPATARWTRSSAPQRRDGHEARLREYHVEAVTGGRDALGEVTVLLELDGVIAPARRVDGHPRGVRQRLSARSLDCAGEGRCRRGGADARARGQEDAHPVEGLRPEIRVRRPRSG